ncbi:hypothetical protein NVP1244A_097 [Vibrio phage 1.244.A._10N.261.54.C3]|nr:hypothetical protein NVP1244A_097 [Vibrio phage 1.244.A._10N.261.54.C3]AUR98725.1 hypothetical protein NVP1255O_097 [Vibrio phage 1.255.O._10N.286.45.F1]
MQNLIHLPVANFTLDKPNAGGLAVDSHSFFKVLDKKISSGLYITMGQHPTASDIAGKVLGYEYKDERLKLAVQPLGHEYFNRFVKDKVDFDITPMINITNEGENWIVNAIQLFYVSVNAPQKASV